MKKKTLYPGLLMLMGALFVSSCGEDLDSGREGTGMIDPLVDLDAGLLSADVQSRAEQAVSVSDLSMTLTSSDGKINRTWKSVDDFDVNEQFPIGEYTVSVAHADQTAEGFDCEPAYYDSKTVKVVEGVTTPVSLTATRTHAMISITYTDAFKNYLSSANVDVVSSSENATTFVYSPGKYIEERPAYIVPGTTKVLVEIEKKNGVKGSNLKAAEFQAEPRHHYHMTIDVNEGNVGKAVLKVTFDEVVDGEEIDIDLSDETIAAPAPELNLEGITAGETASFVEGFYAGEPVRLSIIARGGIASVKLTTKSTYFRDLCAWSETTELIGLESNLRDRLTNHGLDSKGIFNNPDRLAVIDFTKALQEIIYFDNDINGNVSSFTVSVVDKNGKTTEQDLTFSVKVDKLNIELSNPSELKLLGTKVDMDMSFNGVNPKDNVKFSYKNERGIDQSLTVEKIEALGGNNYRVSLADLPSDEKPLTIAAICNGKTAHLEVSRIPYDFTLATAESDLDVFATRAYLTLSSDECDASTLVRLASFWSLGSTARSGATKLKATQVGNGAAFLVEGLVPGAANKIAASLVNNPDVICEPITLNTEYATQLPNAGMEDWFRVDGKTKYWWVEYPGTGTDAAWGTMNLLTTSVGDGNTSMFSHKGTSYCAFSGTRATSDVHGGSKAAIISTVGWGDNDANGSTSTGKGCKNLTVGELYLGHYDRGSKSAVYDGLTFASRPSAMKFFYKYVHKNSADFGTMEVKVVDAQGAVLASGTTNELKAVSEYTEVSIPLQYERGVAKAARIFVSFKSSGNPDCQKINNDNLSCPSFGNLSDGRFTGSELYVDDIELIY